MKPSARTFSHLVAAAIGIAIAAVGTEISRETPSSSSPVAVSRVAGSQALERTSRGSGKRDRPTEETLTTDDFQTAWVALVYCPLPRLERIPIQRMMFEAWAQVDLRAAMDAAMNEGWGRGPTALGTAYFSKAFADRPLDAWKLIQSGKQSWSASRPKRKTKLREPRMEAASAK